MHKILSGFLPPFLACLAALLLVSCGGVDNNRPVKASFVPADGQVNLTTATPTNVNAYAAARFLEQASWGPTPAAVAEVQRLGMEGWIDAQLKKPATVLNAPNYVIDFDDQNQAQNNLAFGWLFLRIYDLAFGGEDQLRQRMAWAIYNFIPIGNTQSYGRVQYFNTLQKYSTGKYIDLLREVTLSPVMGAFLNNDQNIASSPNENYAREIMQLFSVGLSLLNQDGTIKRTAAGAPIETYSQADVIAATKALSGWNMVYEANLPQTNWANFGKRMIPRPYDQSHDSTEKKVLSKTIPAGQNITADLDSFLTILTQHPNNAPFVVRRLIQSFVSSDPSPEYMTRMSKVYTDSQGDLSKVIKAILLDPEARMADDPTKQSAKAGKIKEPVLYYTNLMRGLGCTSSVKSSYSPTQPFMPNGQRAYEAPNVFGFFPPNHKAPESLTPAPEQKLLTSAEIRDRAQSLSWDVSSVYKNFEEAGCEFKLFTSAVETSNLALVNLVSERFFKGAMPAPIRLGALNLLNTEMSSFSSIDKVTNLLQVVLSTPTFGVVK